MKKVAILIVGFIGIIALFGGMGYGVYTLFTGNDEEPMVAESSQELSDSPNVNLQLKTMGFRKEGETTVNPVYLVSKSQIVTHPQGKFILTGDGNNLYFRCIEAYGTIAAAGQTYVIHGKPTTSEVFEGYGVLASGNPMELALEAWICAALNRHVAHLEPDAYWNNASAYYNAGPCNYFSKFWHDHSERGGLAYGFCYDDVNDHSATTFTTNARGVVVRLGF